MPILGNSFQFTTDRGNMLAVNTESQLNIFRTVVAENYDIYARRLGLYGDVFLNRELKGRFASLSTPRNMFTSRRSCQWNPKSGLRMSITEFNTCPIEWDGEQCTDAISDCFERLFGNGVGVESFYSTAEGQQLLALLMERVNLGLGNSFFDLYNFSNHPIISEVNTLGTYAADVETWTDYVDQMVNDEGCGGLITLLDALRADGNPYYTGLISNADINETTGEFTGDIQDLLESLIASASPDLKTAMKSGVALGGGVRVKPVILLTSYEFTALRRFLQSSGSANEASWYFMLKGEDGVAMIDHNVLMYNGLPVIEWDACNSFDAVTGCQSHRAAIVMPGVMGILSNVPSLEQSQYNGMGLVMQESPLIKDKGKIYMHTALRWGAGIADSNFIVMKSNIIYPTA